MMSSGIDIWHIRKSLKAEGDNQRHRLFQDDRIELALALPIL